MSSRSSSSTAQTVWQQDNRRVIGQGGVSAENSTVNMYSLDGEVVNRVFDFAGKQSGQAFDFGGQALALTNDVVAQALGFGKGAMTAVANANADALSFAEATSSRSEKNAYNFATDALGGALGFGTNALNKAFNAADVSAALVKDAYADAKGRGALTDKILMGAIAAMAVVALMAVKK